MGKPPFAHAACVCVWSPDEDGAAEAGGASTLHTSCSSIDLCPGNCPWAPEQRRPTAGSESWDSGALDGGSQEKPGSGLALCPDHSLPVGYLPTLLPTPFFLKEPDLYLEFTLLLHTADPAQLQILVGLL